MNKAYLGISIILACAVVTIGQTDKNTKTPPLADSGRRVVLMSGTSIDAQLQNTVDINNARVGDQVVLKTTKSIKQNGDVLIPKGTTLIGRITEVQRRTKDNSQSRLGMIVDRVQGNGLSSPLSASIVSITSVAARSSMDDSLMSDVSGSSRASASGSSGSGGGGGLLGGVGNTVGGLVNTTTQTTGAVTGTVNQTAAATTGIVGRGLNGIQLSTSASGSANSSTTLSSPNKNLRVEKGATFNLRVNNQASVQE